MMDEKRGIARELHARGWTYRRIGQHLDVPWTHVAEWCRAKRT